MARWEPNARERLMQAAMELYTEQGFEQTTVTQIAERAGLTQRTFFRHFADKREVLFSGAEAMREVLVATVAEAPGSAGPLQAVSLGLLAVAERFDTVGHDQARRRSAVILADAGLRERELMKLAAWAAALTETLRGRGAEEPAASLTAEIGIAVFRASFALWIADDNSKSALTITREVLDELKVITA